MQSSGRSKRSNNCVAASSSSLPHANQNQDSEDESMGDKKKSSAKQSQSRFNRRRHIIKNDSLAAVISVAQTSINSDAVGKIGPAEQVVIDRVEHLKETGNKLTKEEMDVRTSWYNATYPGGYTLSEEELRKKVPPIPKYLQPSSDIDPCSKTANILYLTGKAFQDNNNYAEAITKYSDAIEHTPKDDTQLACKVELSLAQCLYDDHRTDPDKLFEALVLLDSNLRHRLGDDKNASLRCAVSIHNAVMRHDPSLGSKLSSYIVSKTYIKALDIDEQLVRIQKSNGECLRILFIYLDIVETIYLYSSLCLLYLLSLNLSS